MWLRGNTHCHTTRSDGNLSPEEMVKKYKEKHDFVALTDHKYGEKGRPESEFVYDYDVDVDGIVVLNGAELSEEYHVTCIKHNGTTYKQLNHPSRWDEKNISTLNRRAHKSGAHHCEITTHAEGYCNWPSQCEVITQTSLDPITSDDAHGAGGVGQTQVVVNAESKKPEGILKALINGNYAIGDYW